MTSRARSGIGAWLCLSATLCLAVIVSSRSDPSELGSPVYWTWALTGLQVMALWVAGRGQAWAGWSGAPCSPDGSQRASQRYTVEREEPKWRAVRLTLPPWARCQSSIASRRRASRDRSGAD
jgi:hypothetical protein